MSTDTEKYSRLVPTSEAAVLYIADVARLLGKTIPAVRAALRRGNYSAVPKPFRSGPRLLAWTRSDFEKWLAERSASTGRKTKKGGKQ